MSIVRGKINNKVRTTGSGQTEVNQQQQDMYKSITGYVQTKQMY